MEADCLPADLTKRKLFLRIHSHCKGLLKWKREAEKKNTDREKFEDANLLTLKVESREISPPNTGYV